MVDPAYNSMDDLHSTQGELNNQGVSVPGISTDLEGVIRTDPPDIGAYEFSLNSVVETGLTPLTISTVSATLQGTVDPRNETVSGTFEYGLTTEYGNSGNWSPAVLTGIGSQAVTTTITGLIPNCLYHYRVTGSTSAGTVHGMDRSFQTSEASATSFTGSNSGQWGDPANWDNGVPGTLTDVLIPAEKLAVVDNSSACHNLTIAANGALTVNSGKNLVISGALNILSDIGGTGSLIADVNGLTQTGITTVQRYLNGASEAWHLLSSPVAGQQISGEFTPSGTYPDGSGYDFYLWQEASETWMNRKAATWQAANGGNSFAAGRGYLVAYQESNPVKTFSGLLFSGEITIPLTNAGVLNYRRHNLVGNPYPSAIDWKSAPGIIKDDLEMEPGGGHNFYVYNSLTGNYGVYSDAAIGDEGTNGTGRYIPAMQGFFIKAKPGVPVTGLTISDEARVHAAAMFLKQSEPDRIRLNVTAQDGTGSDEVILEFGHNDDLGGAGKWFSINPDAPSLYTAKDGVKYAISFLSTAGNQPFAALNFKPGKSANYCLRASGTNGVNTDFILEDMVAGINIDFSLQQEYLFSARNSDRDDRFHIHFKSTGLVHSNSAAPVSFRYQRGVLVVCGQFPGEKLTGEIEVYDLPGKLVQKNVIDGVSPVGIGLLVTPGVLIVRGVINGTLVTGKVVPANICPTSF
jgi:hypothetical protein